MQPRVTWSEEIFSRSMLCCESIRCLTAWRTLSSKIIGVRLLPIPWKPSLRKSDKDFRPADSANPDDENYHGGTKQSMKPASQCWRDKWELSMWVSGPIPL